MAALFVPLLMCLLLQSKGIDGGVTNTELSNFMTSIWFADVNAFTGSDVRVDRQGHTYTSSSSDRASHNLFTYVDEQSHFQKPTYAAFLKLLDNFNRIVGHGEYVSHAENTEISNFLTEISKTRVMHLTLQFLHSEGYSGATWSEFAQQLHRIWFDVYSRHGNTPDSSGFEHVFVGEVDAVEVVGFHNWIQFHLQEKAGHLDYQGYIFTKPPNILGTHFDWYGKPKKLGTLMYGTSPEFDMAMYTVCFFARRNQRCNFIIDGNSVALQTYDISRGGQDHLGTAYVD